MKPFLILQLRPEDKAADGEFKAFLRFGGLEPDQVERVRMEQNGIPRLNLDDFSGVIVGGGPANASDPEEKKEEAQKKYERDLAKLMDEINAKDFPFLGACYGLGFLSKHLGGNVSKEKYAESVGAIKVILTEEGKNDPLTKGLPETFKAFVGHKESCQNVPEGALHLATSTACPYQMIRFKNNIYATQFHPELDAAGACLRIDVYKNYGYFPPEDAEKLKAECRAAGDVTVPARILARFVERYRKE